MRYQLVIVEENYAREEDLSPVLISTLSKDVDEQLKLAHKVVDVVEGVNRKPCVTLLRYSVNKSESFSARNQFSSRNQEYEKFQQIVYVKYKLRIFQKLTAPKTSPEKITLTFVEMQQLLEIEKADS